MNKRKRPTVIFLAISILWTLFAVLVTPLQLLRTCDGVALPFPYEVHFQYIQRIDYGQIATYENESSVHVTVTDTYEVETKDGSFLIQEGMISPASESDGVYGAVFGVKDYCVRLLGGVPSRTTKRDAFPEGNDALPYELYNEREGFLFKSDELLFDITDAIWKDGGALRGRAEWDATGVACICVLAAAECMVVLALTVGRKKQAYSPQVSGLLAEARAEYDAEILARGRKRYLRYTHTIQSCYLGALSALCLMAFAVVNIATASRAVFWMLNGLFLLALFLCAVAPLRARQAFLRKLEACDLLCMSEYSTEAYPLQTGRIGAFDRLLYLCESLLLDGRPGMALELLNAGWITMPPQRANQRLHARFLHFVLVSFLQPELAPELLPALCHDCALAPYSALRRLGVGRTERRQTAPLLEAYGSQNWGEVLTLTAQLPPLSHRTAALWLMRARAATQVDCEDVLGAVCTQLKHCPRLAAWLETEIFHG